MNITSNMKITKNSLLFLLIIIVSLLKLGLVGKGFLAYPDEQRYLASGKMIESLHNLDFQSFTAHLFSTQGRPGEAILKMIPAGFQILTAKLFGYQLYESDNAFPLFIFNYIIYCLILLVHYKFSLHFLKDKFLSLFSVLVFACLIASYISLRHADPYDCSLLILYYIFYKIVKYDIKNKKLFLYGFIAFFGYLCYPGYISLFMAIPMTLFLNGVSKDNLYLKIREVIIFGSGSFLCLCLFELASRISIGKSFIGLSYMLSTSITQGSFEECFSFLFKYLYQAEGGNGLLLIIGLLLFIIVFLYQFKEYKIQSSPTIYIVFLSLFLLFISYAALGYYFHKVVFYARLLRQFMPFIVLFSVFSIQTILNHFNIKNLAKNSIVFCLAFYFSINFYFILIDYKTYFYPKDVAWDIYNTYHFKNYNQVFEYKNSLNSFPELPHAKQSQIKNDFVFVNFCVVYPFNDIENYKVYQNQKNYNLIFSGTDCLGFKAYQFEGYNIEARENIDKTRMKIKVYQHK